jgi:hypothetical protein
MVLSLTALIELFSSLSLGILAYRWWQVFNERKSLITRLLFYFVGILSLYFFFDSFLILLFAEIPMILKFSVISGVFFQSLACAFLAYLIIHIFIPKINPIFGFSFIFILGLIGTFLAIFIPFSPFLRSIEPIKTIEWNLPLPIGFLQSFIFSITLLPISFIFLFYSQTSKPLFIKLRSVGMALAFLFGLNAGFVNFFSNNWLKIGPLGGDISLGFFSLFLFSLLFYFSFQNENYKEKGEV